MSYDEAVGWLYGTQLHGIKLGLENVRRLVDALGIRLTGRGAPRYLHVAGTNGKGSVCAMLDAICRAAGHRTGLFTSPHLVTFRERIRVNGAMMGEAEVAAGLLRIRRLVANWEHSPTFFEITTALALAYFQKRGADVVVLETGMGGRLDATNIVTPAVSVITAVDLDHQQYLGSTLTEIASEKAGIIKPGVPVVTAPQHHDARSVIGHLALERDAPLHLVMSPLNGLPMTLIGSHQCWNAALAVHALEVAGLGVSGVEVARGLAAADWPGRFQQVTDRLVLDGAHNPAAAHRLAETWREVHGDAPATIVLGILKDKDVRGICEALGPIAARIIVVPVQNERTTVPEEVAEIVRELLPGIDCQTASSLASGLKLANTISDRVLVTGSLFLIGEALSVLGQSAQPLEVSAQ